MSKEEKSSFETLVLSLITYVNAKVELLKLNAIGFATRLLSSLLKLLVVGSLISAVLLFLGMGLAFWVGDLFDKQYVGFFIVGGLFILITLFVILVWKAMVKSAIMRFVVQIFENEEDE